MDVQFFLSSADFRAWLEAHHASAREQWVGFYKKHTGKPGISYLEAVDQALCFGWIDGLRKTIDDASYKIRFTPRKVRSIWSDVNLKRAGELMQLRLMQPAGLKAYEGRDQQQAQSYSYEVDSRELDEAFEQQFRAQQEAWDFFQAQAPSYQKAANWWVMSAKKPETRLKRLATLIADSQNGRKLSHLTPR